MALIARKFEREKKKKLKFSDFSFAKTQKLLNDCKTSFADEVITERRESNCN
jgi:hypothetical protein